MQREGARVLGESGSPEELKGSAKPHFRESEEGTDYIFEIYAPPERTAAADV